MWYVAGDQGGERRGLEARVERETGEGDGESGAGRVGSGTEDEDWAGDLLGRCGYGLVVVECF